MSYCPQQLVNFMGEFFTDISTLRTSIKSTVYKILDISIEYPVTHQQKIKSDIPSILLQSKKTFQDLKRIDSLLKGYLKSKKNNCDNHQYKKNKNQNMSFNEQMPKNITFNQDNDNKIFSVHNLKNGLINFSKQKSVSKFTLSSTPNNHKIKKHKKQKHQIHNQQENNDHLILSQLQAEIDMFPQKVKGETQILSEKAYSQFDRSKYKKMKDKYPSQKYCQNRSKRVNTMYETFEYENNDILKQNERAISEVIDRNSQCLNIIKSLRAQLLGKGYRKKE